MATIIKTLKQGEDQILPRTSDDAVIMGDGTRLSAAIKSIDSANVKITGELATQLGVPEGTTLSTILANYQNSTAAANVLATAEWLEE